MADSGDDFEIDIYGDDTEQPQAESAGDVTLEDSTPLESVNYNSTPKVEDQVDGTVNQLDGTTLHDDAEVKYEQAAELNRDGDSTSKQIPASQITQPAVPQGVKRKEAPDDLHPDPHASAALLLSDLNWWNTDDTIRGWANQGGAEGDLRDVTFSEHKVNGKSKGQAYIDFNTPQAATAMKRYMETSIIPTWIPANKKLTVGFSNASNNPFRTMPKDGPARGVVTPGGRGGFHTNNDRAGAYSAFGARGKSMGRGGFIQRGSFNQGMPGGNFGMGGGGGFQGNAMGNMNFNRGGMMQMGVGPMGGGSMRGNMNGRGRGGGGFGPIPMGGMMPNMGMPGTGFGAPMGMMAGYGASAQGYMNPAFFGGGQQMGGGDWNNPHGAKRPRGE